MTFLSLLIYITVFFCFCFFRFGTIFTNKVYIFKILSTKIQTDQILNADFVKCITAVLHVIFVFCLNCLSVFVFCLSVEIFHRAYKMNQL